MTHSMDILQTIASTVPATQTVGYSCMLTNTWSGRRHPEDYPSGMAHWSPPVLIAHNTNYEVWSPGTFASPGVEAVAEGGDTSLLEGEYCLAEAEGIAGDIVVGVSQANSLDPPQLLDAIELSPKYPLLSTISMAAPSPDWFSGIYNFSPLDEAQEYWYRSFVIASFPFDAGTEQGEFYSIDNDPEPTHLSILQLTNETVPASGVFLDSTGTEVLPVAYWSCVLDEVEDDEVVPPTDSGTRRGLLKTEAMTQEKGATTQQKASTDKMGSQIASDKMKEQAPGKDTQPASDTICGGARRRRRRNLSKQEATIEASSKGLRGALRN